MSKAKLTQSQLQQASTLIKQSAAAREACRKASPLNRADLAGDPHLRDNRRALQALLASYAVKSGLDVERLEQINAKNQDDLRRVVEARKAAAVEQSTSTMNALRQGVADRRKALEYLANRATPATSPPIVLEEPIAITAGGGLVLGSSNIENWSSTAKLFIQSRNGSLDQGALCFSYVWVNPNDAYAQIAITAPLAFNGFCKIWSNGRWYGSYPGDLRESGLNIDAALDLSGVTVTPSSGDLTYQVVVDLKTKTEGWLSGTVTETAYPSEPHFFQVNSALVLPRGMVLIEQALAITYYSDDGEVEVDFSNGDFNILSPYVAITFQ